MEYYTTAA